MVAHRIAGQPGIHGGAASVLVQPSTAAHMPPQQPLRPSPDGAFKTACCTAAVSLCLRRASRAAARAACVGGRQ